MTRRILCLWFPSWPLQRLVVDHPALRGQPLVLYANQARQGQRVVCCSAAAYARGIRAGMSLAEASSLPRTALCEFRDGLHFEQHDPVADLAQLERLAVAAQQYSPVVGLEQDQPASCLFMEIFGSAARLGGEMTLVPTLAEDLHRQGYVPRIAVADTVGAAWAISHYGELEPLYEYGGGFPPANLASEAATVWKSTPQVVIGKALCLPAGHGTTYLTELPIESLRLDSRSLNTLHALGILRVGQLLQLPRDGIAARFDAQLLSRMDQATGNTSEPIVFSQTPIPLHASHCFEQPTQYLATIEQVVHQLLDTLAERLSQRGEGALQLECRFIMTTASESVVRVGLYQPTAVTEHLFELVQMQLQNRRFHTTIQQIVIDVVCSATILRHQPGLLPDSCQAVPAQLRNLIERMSSRLGTGAVVFPKLYADALPEHAYRYLPLTSSGSGNKLRMKRGSRSASEASRHLQAAGLRPLRLYDPVRQIRVVTAAAGGTPASFQYEGNSHRVTQAWGPERIETGWWRGPTVRRDYFRVEEETGGRFWIFRELTSQHWFLHGMFT